MKALLDTHILGYWLGEDPRLSAAQTTVIEQATLAEPLWVAESSLWENRHAGRARPPDL